MRILKVINPFLMDTDGVYINADQISSYYYDVVRKRTKIIMDNKEYYEIEGDAVKQISAYLKGSGPVQSITTEKD